MSKRLSVLNHSQAMKPLFDFSAAVHGSGLERPLVELILLRVSQMNGCAYCIDMHSKDARAQGETEQRLYALNAWREAPFYSDKERAALGWTEAVTDISHKEVTDELYQEARRHFNEQELVRLTVAIVAINGWNRLCVSFRIPSGSYQPKKN